MTDKYTHIGEVIAYLRKKKGVSQAALAENICSREYLGKIEKGYQYPTSAVINELCEKLGIDIYEEYSLILRHGGFDRHNMITELNDSFSKEKILNLPSLITKCEKNFPQIDGELFQNLCYAKAIYALDIEHNPSLAQDFALQGILYSYPNYSLDAPLTNYTLSNIELLLIYYYINSLCEYNSKTNAVLSYLHLYQYLKERINTNQYIVHKKHHFEINLLSTVVVNMTLYHRNLIPYETLYKLVNDTIELKKQLDYSNSITNLLFEKCYLCKKLGYLDEYEKTLNTAKVVGEFYLGKESSEKLVQWLNQKD